MSWIPLGSAVKQIKVKCYNLSVSSSNTLLSFGLQIESVWIRTDADIYIGFDHSLDNVPTDTNYLLLLSTEKSFAIDCNIYNLYLKKVTDTGIANVSVVIRY